MLRGLGGSSSKWTESCTGVELRATLGEPLRSWEGRSEYLRLVSMTKSRPASPQTKSGLSYWVLFGLQNILKSKIKNITSLNYIFYF